MTTAQDNYRQHAEELAAKRQIAQDKAAQLGAMIHKRDINNAALIGHTPQTTDQKED